MAGATVPETVVAAKFGFGWGSDGAWVCGALHDTEGGLGCGDEVAGEAIVWGGCDSWGPSASPTQPRPNLVPGGSTCSIRFATSFQAVGLSLAANRARLRE